MQLPDTLPVTVAYELYGLDANLQPGELILATRRLLPDFPYLDTTLVKQEALKEWLCTVHAHTEALYFTSKVLRPGSDAPLFSYEDFFEPDPDKRCAIAWRWDTTQQQGVGMALYKEQQN
jgi:hypothetical protein